jgi:hypothetical protein
MKRVESLLPPIPTDFWAHGCPNCKHGIVSAPELTGAGELYLERMVQAIDGDIEFCKCRAGQAYRSSLLNRYEAMKDAAKRDGRMADAAQRKTHPDIEATRRAMGNKVEFVRVPTMRYVGNENYPVPPEAQSESETA